MMPPMLAFGSLPDENVLRDKACEVLARSDFHLQPPGESTEWLIEAFLTLLKWLIAPFKWIYELSEGLPGVLRWLIVLIFAVAVAALVAHIIYTLVLAMRGGERERFVLPTESAPVRMSATELEQLAESAAARGELIVAVRFLFRASLARLELREKKLTRRGLTNREHLRRYRGTPFFEPLEILVSTIEWKWYGEQTCANEDWETCRQAYQSMAGLAVRIDNRGDDRRRAC